MSDLSTQQVEALFPAKLQCLFKPKRYKTLYGGRGGTKSWGAARALLIQGANRPLRILCAREIQKSIADSVHQLLKDQISALGLEDKYNVQENAIIGRNGTQFSFAGLRSQNVTSIKSFEGVDICWVEEAQAVTKRSWNILTPTIRKPGSEIWVTFNPELDTDETYMRFVTDPPDDSFVVNVNYSDNPWPTAELDKERDDLKRRDPDEYEVVWLGKCRPAVQGAIYLNEMRRIADEKRLCNVPYDPLLKVHTVWDMGWNDSMAIILVQRVRSEIRVIDFIEDSHRTLDDYAAQLNDKRLNWGTDYLPHDARAADYKTGKSGEELLRKFRKSVQVIPALPVEQGIKATRLALNQCYFDRKATGLVDHLKRYRRNIPVGTNEPTSPLHDEHSHAADAMRYLATVADKMTNEDWSQKKIDYPDLKVI